MKNKDFGPKLRRLRDTKGYSQENVADMLGIHQNTYSKWELGATQLKAEKIPTLAEIYEMDLLEFCKELYEYSLNNHNQRGGNAANVVVDNASEQTVKNLESQISQLKEELGFLKEEIIFLRNLVNR